ncbi:hypothetical protein Dimus_038710 [Dionaea muscipula]
MQMDDVLAICLSQFGYEELGIDDTVTKISQLLPSEEGNVMMMLDRGAVIVEDFKSRADENNVKPGPPVEVMIPACRWFPSRFVETLCTGQSRNDETLSWGEVVPIMPLLDENTMNLDEAKDAMTWDWTSKSPNTVRNDLHILPAVGDTTASAERDNLGLQGYSLGGDEPGCAFINIDPKLVPDVFIMSPCCLLAFSLCMRAVYRGHLLFNAFIHIFGCPIYVFWKDPQVLNFKKRHKW